MRSPFRPRAGAAAGDPAVSILLPVRDGADTLEACLESVRRQTDPDWECVVVDDGSRDGTARIARRWADRDGRFVSVRRPPEGLVAALNEGLARCRGRYVARMDADDWMARDRLARQRAALEADPDLAAVGCHVRIFPRAGLGAGMRRYEAWLNGMRSADDVAREAFVECPLAHPTWLARREILTGLGYRACGWPEDYDWLLRARERGLRLGVVPRRLVGWRHGAGRLSQRHPDYAAPRFTACKAHFLARGLLAGEREYVLWGHGGTGRALRRALEAEGRRPSHVVELHPGRLGNRIHGAPVVPPEALPGLRGRPVVVSVAGAGPRAEIRAALARMGFVELRDYVCAA